jgi:hypothetical protein
MTARGKNLLFLRVSDDDSHKKIVNEINSFYNINEALDITTSGFVPAVYLVFGSGSKGDLAQKIVDSDEFMVDRNDPYSQPKVYFMEPVYSKDLVSFGSFDQEYKNIIVISKHVHDSKNLFNNAIAGVLSSSAYGHHVTEWLDSI